jgi:hypothetical protein
MNNQIFISYSHKDRIWLEKFQTMLKPLMKNETLVSWDDTCIKPGTKWKEAIEDNLRNSSVALLLVSPDFLASDFITNNELPALLENAEKKGLTILWVATRASMYKSTSIAEYQAAHDPSKPLSSLSDAQLDSELVEICTKIANAIVLTPPIAQQTVLSPKLPFNGTNNRIEPIPSSPTTANGLNKENPAEVLQIALIYKRNAKPDEDVVKLLENYLKLKGHSVFIDRHLSIGVKWAEEIERQLRQADIVIPLLSSASISSEMLHFEIETAHDSAQKIGKPKILPIRTCFHGQLEGSLGSILNPLQYAVWDSSDDDETLLEQIEASFTRENFLNALRPEPAGGVVPIDSNFYIVRNADKKLKDSLEEGHPIILVKGARQTGKTSLLARGLNKAKQKGCKVIVTDFQKLNVSSLETIDSFYLGLTSIIANQLRLPVYPKNVWDSSVAPNLNFENYITNHVLKDDENVIWAMDEVDRLFTTPFGSEVFGLFRSWFNERAYLTGPLEKMSLVIVYASEAQLFITDPYQSPFNVGTKLEVSDFDKKQVEELNFRYGKCLQSGKEIDKFYQLVGGHPYLVRRTFYELATQHISVQEFTKRADSDEGPFGDHLRRILVMLGKNFRLWEAIREISEKRKCSSSDSFYRLRTGGVVVGDSQSEVDFRCQIYKSYLTHHMQVLENEATNI